jgi:hypothetical protein
MGNPKGNGIRKDIENAFSQLQQVFKSSLRPLPSQTGDGTYLVDINAPTGAFKDLPYIKPKDVETVLDVVKTAATGAPLNDRQYILERVIQLTSRLPSTSRTGQVVSDAFVRLLWNDLQHPPIS